LLYSDTLPLFLHLFSLLLRKLHLFLSSQLPLGFLALEFFLSCPLFLSPLLFLLLDLLLASRDFTLLKSSHDGRCDQVKEIGTSHEDQDSHEDIAHLIDPVEVLLIIREA